MQNRIRTPWLWTAVLLAVPEMLSAGEPPLLRIEDGRLLLPTCPVKAMSVTYFACAEFTDPDRIQGVLAMVEAGRVVPADSTLDEAGPSVYILWETVDRLRVRTSIGSDTVSFDLMPPGDGDSICGALIAPGLADTIRTALQWKPFLFPGIGRINRLDFLNWQEQRFTSYYFDRRLARLVTAFQVAPEIPMSCPFWNHVRLDTDRGVVFCSLVADGDYGTVILAPSSPDLERAWQKSGTSFQDAIFTRGTQYAIAQDAYRILRDLARAHGMTLEFFARPWAGD